MYSVYALIFNNTKTYIGLTTRSIEIRKKEHISCSIRKNPKYLLHKAIKKYGEESFEMITLETTNNKDELKMLEKKYIKEYNSYFENEIGYNMSLGGEGNFGYKFTDEIKIKMSQIKKEMYKNNPILIEEWKQKIKKYWTNENKQKMSNLKKEQHKNNPQIVEKWRKSRGEWTEDQRIKHQLIVKNNFEKNPERAKQISERMKIFGNTLEGKIRGDPKPFNVHNLNGVYIGTYNYVPFAVNDILNEKKLLNDISEITLGKNIRRVLSGERNHTKGFMFKYL